MREVQMINLLTGTPEMLSPASYDGAPTPPPQPSPGAFKSYTLDRPAYQNKYATSPRDQHVSPDSRYGSSRYDQVPQQQFDGVQSQRQYSQSPSSRVNGVYATMPHNRVEDFSARSRQSPQIIRKDNPPAMNISAKSVSTPNISMNSQDHSRNNQQDEDLAVARYCQYHTGLF